MAGGADAIVWIADGEATPDLDYGRRLEEQLELRGLHVLRASLKEPDPTLVEAAPLHLLTGGATSVNAAGGWMPHALQHTRLLIDRAQHGQCGLLGICLGAQMIAASTWRRAVTGGDRIEVGLTPVRWAGGDRGSDVVASFHYEKVRPEAVAAAHGEIVASNDLTEVQAFSLGARILGVQFHPELTPDDVLDLVEHHRPTIEAYGGDVAEAVASVRSGSASWSPDVLGHLVDRVTP